MTVTRLGVRMPELWAGVECTVNRVGDSYSDQLERSGRALRIKDLERLAELGVRRLRYPILWERTAPEQRLGLTPIVGLVHHGSGPRYTNLLDPEFVREVNPEAKPEMLGVSYRKSLAQVKH